MLCVDTLVIDDRFALHRLRETSAPFRELLALIGRLPDTRQVRCTVPGVRHHH